MGIQTASILVDGTVATTGGSATTFITKGDTLNEKRVTLDDSSEFIANVNVQFSVSDPVKNAGAPNGYTQKRSTVKMLVPLALDNALYTMNTMTIQLSVDPETTDAEVESMLVSAAQLLHDSDFSDFWKKQSLA
jgi:hypothetical protein